MFCEQKAFSPGGVIVVRTLLVLFSRSGWFHFKLSLVKVDHVTVISVDALKSETVCNLKGDCNRGRGEDKGCSFQNKLNYVKRGNQW